MASFEEMRARKIRDEEESFLDWEGEATLFSDEEEEEEDELETASIDDELDEDEDEDEDLEELEF